MEEKEIPFEEAIKKLEEIVGNLEKGQLPLKESYTLFETGVSLSKYCENILNDTEKKVEVLLFGSKEESA